MEKLLQTAPFYLQTKNKNLKIEDHELNRDDLTIPEKIICICLFCIVLAIFLYFMIKVVFIKLQLAKKKKSQKLTKIHYWIIILISVTLLARLASLSDALTIFFTDDEDYHFIPVSVDFMISSISFLSMTELSSCFCLLW